ncbi:type I restriction enzyme, S subunit [Enterococcus sp. DIV0784]|uniref:restriction endonuclease subunit S n=1 Tax=unclassified Enterococcus TaxID=2608891 RepID=UPI003F26E3B2
MSNDTLPEIRFPEFTDEWEQVKLKDVATVFDGTHQTPKYTESGVKFVSVENIKTLETEKYISQEAYDSEYSKKQAEKGDVLMTRIGDIGTAKVIETDEPLAYYVTLALLKPNEIDSSFLAWLIPSPEVQRNIWKRTLHIAFPKKINLGEINQIEMNVPSLEEQTKIGTFFQNLDQLITLHQRKLDLLKETKKGFLQKMFPKNGAKVPEIRFPGFTEDWEERRLQEVVDRYDNLRIPITASKRVAGNTPYYGANGIQGYVEGYTHDGAFILVAEDGANDLKNYPVQYVDGKVWVNNHAHVIQAKENLADNMFLMNAIRSINIEPFLVGGGRAKLNADVLMKLEVIIPLKSEQQKIGAFFKQLDDTIALHQRKLDLLKETKKGFLQKMFV